MILSPSEYQQALSAGWDAMPPAVLNQLVTRAVLEIKPERRRGAKLSWIMPSVKEGYDTWRRAVGPN